MSPARQNLAASPRLRLPIVKRWRVLYNGFSQSSKSSPKGRSALTVGIGIQATDGFVLACDSLSTMGRGSPVLRYTNKVNLIQHQQLLHPIGVTAAGYVAYFDKFKSRAIRDGITNISNRLGRKLDIVDFCEQVCEPLVTALLKEYQIDRNAFVGAPLYEFSLAMIVAGATRDGELRAYTVYPDGTTDPVEQYGTIGSGAAYAELFLRYLLTEERVDSTRAGRLSIYAVKGVELIDPNVGGEPSVKVIKMSSDRLNIQDFPQSQKPPRPKERMEEVLRGIGRDLEKLLVRRKGRGSR